MAIGFLIATLLICGVATAEEDPVPAEQIITDPFQSAVENLKQQNFAAKGKAIEQLQSVDDPRVLKIFQYLLNGKLYSREEDQLLVFADPDGDAQSITDVINGNQLGVAEASTLKKIILNNQLRKQLRGAIAQLSLGSKDTAVRLSAVTEMLRDPKPEVAELVRAALTNESDSAVKEKMAAVIALSELDSADKTVRLNAIRTLGQSMESEAFNNLSKLVQKDEQGEYLEADAEIRNAASAALTSIKDRRGFYELMETIFFGLSLGSVLLLAAIGLAITFGVMGVINMAHGELIMLGAYTTYVVQLLMPNYIEYSLFVAIPAAFLVSGLFGIAIERGVIRFLYGRPLETLLATFGISLILQQLVRSVFSPLNRSVETPAWMSGAMEINGAFTLTFNRFYILIFSLMVFIALLAVLKKTPLGLQVRAVSQNRAMAKAMGVKTEWVDALTFGLGSGIAGVAGVALSQLTNVGPNLGQSYIIDSFMVVVFGGVGNLWGTLVGAMSLGVVNKFLEPWSGAVMAKILVLVFIILFIQKKPRGLFPQKGRAAET
ncbi:MAG: urea ABC transporter permease subunit UrtB [Gammaproteobacteria bacterium]|nr:urea ABC transporter permease subunit UrtB [Gammaproteobacteria bacterium]